MKVGFCPGSILRYNSILAESSKNYEESKSCNVFYQDINLLNETPKKYGLFMLSTTEPLLPNIIFLALSIQIT